MDVNQSQTFTSSVSGGTQPYSYQWYLNGTAQTGATSSTWIFTPTQAGNYNVYLNVNDSLSNQAQSNIVNDIIVYNQTQESQLVPDWNNVTQDFFTLVPGAVEPVLTAADVTDRKADYVADPFMFHENNTWYMFFEVDENAGALSEIGLATSSDGFTWTYQQIVISEPFSMAYPYVFKWNGTYYLIPETYELDQMVLFQATNFPYNWTMDTVLIQGSDYGFFPVDSSIFRYNNMWWLFTGDDSNLYLFYSNNLTDPASWHMTPNSPIIANDPSEVRGGGRTIVFDNGRIIRLTQEGNGSYGQAVRAFEIDTLTQTSFSEHEVTGSPIIQASGSGWNAYAMHTLDPWWTGNSWLADVDAQGENGAWTIGIYVSPLNVTIAPNQVRMNVNQSQTFTASASGGRPPYTYQWYKNGTAVPGATSSTWTFTPTQTGHYNVYVNVTDNLNNQAQSNIVTDIIVYNQPSVSISPTSANIVLGGSQQFNSTVTGGTPPNSYQWVLNGTAVSGATSSTWVFTPAQTGHFNVYVNVTDSLSNKAQSNIVTNILVYSPLSVAINPTSANITLGGSQTFTSALSGGVPPTSYQWYLNGSAVSGATSATWKFTPASVGHYNIYVNTTDSLNNKALSNTATAFVSSLVATISPTSANIAVGQSQQFTSTVTGGSTPYTYQWYLNGTQVTGATSSTWNLTGTSVGTFIVYLNVTDNNAITAQSNNATVKVTISVVISPAHVQLYYGQSQTFSSTVAGGTAPYTYQWVLNGTAVPGANTATWMFTPTANGNYNVYLNVTDSLNNKAQSNTITDISVYSVNLLLTAGANQPTYTQSQTVTFTVDVFNAKNPSLQSTLTLTVTGPNGYYFYDFQPINVPSGANREYSFDWKVPNTSGTYIVETSLAPALLTAYDATWLNVSAH
jgi:hypothetical protein